MAPNSQFCGDGGRQSMMSVPSLVLIPADNPNDIKVLSSGKKCANLLPDTVTKPPPVPAINVIPPSPRFNSNRRKWDENVQKAVKINTVDENEAHDWSMEDSEQVQTKVSSKCHSNTYVNNKNVTPFVIRRSPLKQVPSSKAEEVGPTQFGGICKLNFNQISMSDESEGSIRTPATPEVEQVYFSYSKKANKIDEANVWDDDVFDEVILTSPTDSTASSKINYDGSNSSDIDSNNNSVKWSIGSNKFYNVTGDDWPPVEVTPEQEQEQFKIFCDKKFRESGGVTPVIVGVIPKSLPGGPTFRMPQVSAHYSYTGGSMAVNRNLGTATCTPAEVHPVNSRIAAEEPNNDFEGFSTKSLSEQDKCEIDEFETNQLGMGNIIQDSNSSCKILSLKDNLHNKQPRNSPSFVTPPTQIWHPLLLQQNGPTPSPSQLCMKMDSSKTVPLWTTPAVMKGPHTQVLPSNSALDNCQDSYLDYPYHTRDISTYNAQSLWSTPAILNTDSSQQVVLRTPVVQGGVYGSFTQGSHYSTLTKRRNYSTFQNQQLEKQEMEIKAEPSTAPLSYMGIIKNIFNGIFGSLDEVDIPVIYPHYEVANGAPTVETEKKND